MNVPLVHDWQKRVVAVTGTIGSGKSTVIQELAKGGAFVVSADELVAELYAPGSKTLQRIGEVFGAEILLPDGSINRKRLGEIVFSDPAKKAQLEQIVHPAVHELAGQVFSEAINNGKSFLVYEVPLLFEAGLDKLGFKEIVVVTAQDDVCVERVVARSGGKLSPDEARRRIAVQIPAHEKAARADVVFDNSGSKEDLAAQIERFVQSRRQ